MDSRHLDGHIDGDLVQRRLIHDFKSLPTRQARRDVLNAILDDLTKDERRELYARPKDPMHYDIVGSLPLELVLEIAGYLKPLQVWIIQRVSKRWQAIFTSKEIYSRVHFRSYPFQLPGPEDKTLSARDMVRRKYGHHLSEVWYEWPGDLNPSFADTSTAEHFVSYSSGKVAWLTADQRIACIRDLMTGAVIEFTTETRGVIRLVHLTQHFLFVQASGYCTAWELSTHKSHQIRLPSPHVLEIHARHDRAIILIGGSSDRSIILSWHFDSDSVRSAHLAGQPLCMCWASNTNTDSNILSVVQAEKEASPELYKLFRQRFAIADQGIVFLDTRILAVGAKIDLDSALFFTFSRFSQFICRYGMIVSQILPLKSWESDGDLIFISYSAKTETLIVRILEPNFDVETEGRHAYVPPRIPYDKGKMILVDGTLYYPDVNWACFRISHILDDTTGDFISPFHAKKVSNCDNYDRIFRMFSDRYVAFGDHQIYGFAHLNGIEVVSFDSRLQLPHPERP